MSDIETLHPATQQLFQACRVSLKGGSFYRSTPADGHIPWIITREQALFVVGLTELGNIDEARQILRALIGVQQANGRWDVGYRPDGTGLQGSGVIESTTIAVWAMLKYAEAADDTQFSKAVEKRMRRALDGTINLLHPQVTLPLVDADYLPPALSAGYSLWTASIAGAALQLAADVYRERDYDEVYGALRHSIEVHLVHDGRFVGRLDPEGRLDLRPMITVLAPILFGLWDVDEEPAAQTLEWVRQTLADARIGGYMPFVAFVPGKIGAFPMVSSTATAWLARLRLQQGEREDAEKLLRWLLGSMVQEALPMGIITTDGLALAERQRDAFMQAAGAIWPIEMWADIFDDLAKQREERSLLHLFSPHLLSHFEAIRAFHAGGYIDGFSIGNE